MKASRLYSCWDLSAHSHEDGCFDAYNPSTPDDLPLGIEHIQHHGFFRDGAYFRNQSHFLSPRES